MPPSCHSGMAAVFLQSVARRACGRLISDCMKRLLTQTVLENGFYLLICTILIVVPVFGYYDGSEVRWHGVVHFWIELLPFLILFALNNYVLMPYLLLRKHYGAYVVCAALMIAVVFIAVPVSVGAPEPPMFCRPAVAFVQDGPDVDSVRNDGDTELAAAPRPVPDIRDYPPPRIIFLPAKWGGMFSNCLLAVLVLGLNIAIKLFVRSMQDARYLKELESQTLKAELNYLKAQVNPHFLMNTLNNIHALIDIDTEKAKTTVIELSRIMRYVLYDADRQTVPLQKEVDFIDNYIRLMSIRYSGDVDIEASYPSPIPDVKVPPLLFITLIENAFKHGVDYRGGSFIHSRLEVADGRLSYSVRNSISDVSREEPGVGLETLRKRLGLLYGDEYSLCVGRKGDCYIAELNIPV